MKRAAVDFFPIKVSIPRGVDLWGTAESRKELTDKALLAAWAHKTDDECQRAYKEALIPSPLNDPLQQQALIERRKRVCVLRGIPLD